MSDISETAVEALCERLKVRALGMDREVAGQALAAFCAQQARIAELEAKHEQRSTRIARAEMAIADVEAERDTLQQQNATLVEAGRTVLSGLEARIRNAPQNAVPLFDGIAELHFALAQAEKGRDDE